MKTRFLKVLTLIMAIVMVAQFMVGCGSAEEEPVTKKPKKEEVTDIDKVTDKLPGTDPVFPPATDKPDDPDVTDKPDDPYVPPIPERWLPQYETEHIKASNYPKKYAYDLSDVYVKYNGTDAIIAHSIDDCNGCEFIISLGGNKYRAVGDWCNRDFEASDVKEFICVGSVFKWDGLVGYIDNSGLVHDVDNNITFSENHIKDRTIIGYYVENFPIAGDFLVIDTIKSDGKLNRLVYNMSKGFVDTDRELTLTDLYGNEHTTVSKITRRGMNWWRVYFSDDEADYQNGVLSSYNYSSNLELSQKNVYFSDEGDYYYSNFIGKYPVTYDNGAKVIYESSRTLNIPDPYTTDDIWDIVKNDSWMIIFFWSEENEIGGVYIYDIHTYNNGKNDFIVYDEELTDLFVNHMLIVYRDILLDSWGNDIYYFRCDDGFLYEYYIDDAYERLYDPSSKIDF